MNWNLLKGYLLAALVLAVLAAGGILVLNNLGGAWQMQVFWKPVTMRPAAWLLCAAAGGLVVWWTLTKVLPVAVAALRAGNQVRRERQTRRDLKDMKQRGPG